MYQIHDADLARLLATERQIELRHSRALTRSHPPRTDRRFRFGRRWRRP